MTRPEDIPEAIWSEAFDQMDIHAPEAMSGDDHLEQSVQTAIARAIMEEREACAQASLNIGNFGDYRRDELTYDFGQPRYDMMMNIVAAIRKRSEA